jgi:hypothetical protein
MILASIVSIAMFTVVILTVARLGAGSAEWLANLWSGPMPPPRARGVQEDDLPRFAFRDARRQG